MLLEISQNSQENTSGRASFLIKLQVLACSFIKKETLEQAFPCEFCEIPKNAFFTEHLRATASVGWYTENTKRLFERFFENDVKL